MQTNQSPDIHSLGLVLVQERNRDIKEVEKDAVDLLEITKDLKELAVSQSQSLDIIDGRVESSVHYLQGSVFDLEEAEKYGESARRRKMYLGFGIITVGLVAGYKVLQYVFSSEKKIKEDEDK
jgi:t-SNARE complex subunit (syntaxin)